MLRFVHLSDTHISPDEQYRHPIISLNPLKATHALIKQLQQLPFVPDFYLHTGDIAYDPDPEVYPMIRDLFSQLPAPMYYVAGNHDDRTAVQTELMLKDDLIPYPFYEIELNGVQMVFVDSNSPASVYHGRVSEEQLDWLDTLCSANDDRPMMIAVHHNVLPCGVPWLDEKMNIENGEEFHEIVRQARDRLRGVFHGHIHQNVDMLRDGVLYSACTSPWGRFQAYPDATSTSILDDSESLPGFSVVSITDNHTYIRRHTYPLEF
jgi:3',5'-cyclic-AMP phosphodiesterase